MVDLVSKAVQDTRDSGINRFKNISLAAAQSGNLISTRYQIDLSAVRQFGSETVSQTGIATTDNVLLARAPVNCIFKRGWINSSVSIATATFNIGTSKTHGSNTQYGVGLSLATARVPANFMAVSALDQLDTTDKPLGIYLTVTGAAAPAAGIITIDMDWVTDINRLG